MKIAAVITALQSGGAERVLSTLCDRWSAEGHQVTLITLGGRDDFSSCLRRCAGSDSLLGASQSPVAAVGANVRRARTLRAAIRGMTAAKTALGRLLKTCRRAIQA